MANELGAGGGSGYPASIDTDGTQETTADDTDFPVINDIRDAIVHVETELGLCPKGSFSDMVHRLDGGLHRIRGDCVFSGGQNSYFFNWQNTEAEAIFIIRCQIVLRTTIIGVVPDMDVGLAASSGAASDKCFFDAVTLNGAGHHDPIDNGGESFKKVDERGGANDWINGKIINDDAPGQTGSYEILYIKSSTGD